MKLTKLLPIATISSLAIITTPIVASCSCSMNNKETEPTAPFDCVLNDLHSDMGLGNNIRAAQRTFEANTEYTFTIDFSVWTDFPSIPNKLKIMGDKEGEFVIVSSITSISIWFDHEKWVEGTDYQIVEGTNGFTYVDWSDTTSEIKGDSILTGRFKVSDKVENGILLTHIESV